MCAIRGATVRLSLDNGSEIRSRTFDAWADDTGVELAFIQPEMPVQNATVERYIGRLRDERRNAHRFRTLADSQRIISRLGLTYSTDRPSHTCWSLTPAAYARTFTPSTL